MMKFNYTLLFAGLASIAIAVSCGKHDAGIPQWPWEDPDPQPKPGPEPGPDPDPDPEPLFKGKPRYVWIDAAANFRYFANDEGRIAYDLKAAKDAGFTDVIVDVRPTEGTVLFKSRKAPQATRLAAWVNGQYKYINRTADFDYLQAFITAGHELGLRVNAAMNTFVGGYGGYYGLESEGPLFSGDMPASWAVKENSSNGIVSSFSADVQGTVFLNPANTAVREYLLEVIGELASYDLDGIILDRCRYSDAGIMSDFSDESRAAFEEYYGAAVENWPSDILTPGTKSLPSIVKPLLKAWMSFRVKTIHDFVEAASKKVHSINSKVRFGCYVGAWYDSYYPSGVNWASPEYNARSSYNWADNDYSKYGFADHCDFMMLGCYAGTNAVYGDGEWTMEGFAKKAKAKIGATECCGGPDVGNGSGFEQGGCENVIPETIKACINACDGYFVFDFCHIRMYEYWEAFKKGFDDYLSTIE